MKDMLNQSENLFSRSLKRTGGFTLVEVAIVVLVLSLLALVAMPAIYLVRQSSARGYCLNNLRQINGAVQQYMVQNNTTAVPDISEITDYFLPDGPPSCKAGGTYSMPATSVAVPTCSLQATHYHELD